MKVDNPDLTLDNPAMIHETALLYGKVSVGEGASFWPYSVVRAELFEVVIGDRTNIQDFVMIHVGSTCGTLVGKNCSITHHCTLHGCTIGDNCLVGINSTIMDGCVIGNNCIIAGHTILKEGTHIPDNSIVMGQPGKVVKTVDNSLANITNANMYYEMAVAHKKGDYRPLTDPEVISRVFKKP